MAIGGMPPHDQLTMPASERMRPTDLDDGGGGRAGSSPIEIYETPLPGSAGQMWGDDSAEVLRHGRPHGPGPGPAPGPPAPAPPQQADLAGGVPPHQRATLLRPPPGQHTAPAPTPLPASGREPMSVWLLAVAFLVSAGLGLGLTVLIGSLIA
jgi:hypothetical protein